MMRNVIETLAKTLQKHTGKYMNRNMTYFSLLLAKVELTWRYVCSCNDVKMLKHLPSRLQDAINILKLVVGRIKLFQNKFNMANFRVLLS